MLYVSILWVNIHIFYVMKSKGKSMRKLLGLAIAFMLTVSAYSAEITSTKDGGIWADPASWVGGKVPTKGDDVIITSKIKADKLFECKTIIISDNSELIVDTKSEEIKCMVQELTNNGTLTITQKSYLFVPDIMNNKMIENEGIIETGK